MRGFDESHQDERTSLLLRRIESREKRAAEHSKKTRIAVWTLSILAILALIIVGQGPIQCLVSLLARLRISKSLRGDVGGDELGLDVEFPEIQPQTQQH